MSDLVLILAAIGALYVVAFAAVLLLIAWRAVR